METNSTNSTIDDDETFVSIRVPRRVADKFKAEMSVASSKESTEAQLTVGFIVSGIFYYGGGAAAVTAAVYCLASATAVIVWNVSGAVGAFPTWTSGFFLCLVPLFFGALSSLIGGQVLRQCRSLRAEYAKRGVI